MPILIPDTIRAAVLFGANDFRVVDKPVPTPGPGEILVKVAMRGSCSTDLKIQTHPFPSQPPFGQFTPGHEWTVPLSRSVPKWMSWRWAIGWLSKPTRAAAGARIASWACTPRA